MATARSMIGSVATAWNPAVTNPASNPAIAAAESSEARSGLRGAADEVLLAVIRLLQPRDVDLLHAKHGLDHAASLLLIRIAHEPTEGFGDHLP